MLKLNRILFLRIFILFLLPAEVLNASPLCRKFLQKILFLTELKNRSTSSQRDTSLQTQAQDWLNNLFNPEHIVFGGIVREEYYLRAIEKLKIYLDPETFEAVLILLYQNYASPQPIRPRTGQEILNNQNLKTYVLKVINQILDFIKVMDDVDEFPKDTETRIKWIRAYREAYKLQIYDLQLSTDPKDPPGFENVESNQNKVLLEAGLQIYQIERLRNNHILLDENDIHKDREIVKKRRISHQEARWSHQFRQTGF